MNPGLAPGVAALGVFLSVPSCIPPADKMPETRYNDDNNRFAGCPLQEFKVEVTCKAENGYWTGNFKYGADMVFNEMH